MLAKKSARSFIITLILMVVTACGGSDAKFEDPAGKTIVKTPTEPVDLGSTVTPSPSPTPVATVVPTPTSVPTIATPTPTPEVSEIDADQDGSNVTRDCNDNDASIHPRAEDIPGDGIDQNCSGADNYLAKVTERREFFSPEDPNLGDALYHETVYGEADLIREEIYYKDKGKILYTVEYFYDDQGYLIKKVYFNKQAIILTEEIENNAEGKKTVSRLTNGETNKLETTIKYQYNPDGTLRREIRTNMLTGEIDWIIQYSYKDGLLDSKIATSEDGTLLGTSVYEYRVGGLLQMVTNKKIMEDGSTQVEQQRYTYNSNDQVSILAVYQDGKRYSVSSFTYELAE
ncbi:MAG: putative metal-binding motif-containing protein [Deltaproteobacteria bacterium]|nr:putative metal-binding motif-containing protein [Deltaproteobacteria bacterium]